jgi:stage II sporulation protein R
MNFLRNIKNKIKNNKQPYIHRNSSAFPSLASPVSNNPRNFAPMQTILLISILLFCTVTAWLIKLNSVHNASLQTGIAEDIIRFHVIANSDSAKDQALKLTVKDTLVESLKPYLNDTDTITQARTVISDKLTYLQEIAEETIQQNGYLYPVKITLEECYFPLKIYGEYSFPAGTYEALRVQIGTAEGKNWWCVMFPPLCFVDETYSIVDEESGETLKHLLTEEEYDTLISKKTPVKVKFKLFEAIKNLFR